MQRKRHINFKYWKDKVRSSTLTYTIQKQLHSIPTLSSYKNKIVDDIVMKNSVKSSVLYSIPCGCVSALLLVGVTSISLFNHHVSAYDVTISTSDSSASASLSLSNPNMTSSAITPGSTATVSTDVTVNVSDADSYSLSLKVDSTTLQNGSTTINPGNVVSDNTWGYKWDNASTYTAPTTTGTNLTVPALSNGAANFTKNLTFGAKFSTSADAGHYKGSGTLSLVATPKKIVNPFGIETMQEMTASICSSAKENDTARLKDARDGKYYWVAKLKDGNCWMVQNLALDLGTSWPDASKSDYNTAVTAYTPVATATSLTSETINTSDTSTRSWNLGNYVIINPTASSNCGYGKASLAECSEQFASVNGKVASDTATFYTDNANATIAGNVYDAHYLVGNYYSWNAATAGTGGTITSGEASGSICPKNWQLPISNSSASKSFNGLITAGAIGTDVAKLTGAGYYFVRGGRINQNTTDLLTNAGDYGDYWSSTPLSNEAGHTYLLRFSGNNTITPSFQNVWVESGGMHTPNNMSVRYTGRSVRCVARTTNGADTSDW